MCGEPAYWWFYSLLKTLILSINSFDIGINLETTVKVSHTGKVNLIFSQFIIQRNMFYQVSAALKYTMLLLWTGHQTYLS